MKKNPSMAVLLTLWITLLISSTTKAADAAAEAWRTNMASFVEQVLAVARKSTIPDERAWTVGGLGGLKRTGTVLSRKGVETGVIPHETGMDGELGTELLKCFLPGTVSWQGVVKSATNHTDRAIHIIEVEFPAHKGTVKIQPVRLEIPFSTISRDRSPRVGDTFAFTGKLRGKKDDILFEQPVEVIYWFAASEERGNQFVFVSLADVTPVTNTK
jgi:hypothetical protein